MSSAIEISPQIWNWYVGFFISMGAVLALTFAFSFAILAINWLYSCARHIESQPTPSPLDRVFLNLSVFQAIAIGVGVVPIGMIAIYYLLFSLVWKLAPNQVEAPPLEFNPPGGDDWFSAMASILIYIIVLALIVAGIIISLLHRYAARINPDDVSFGLFRRFFRRYFHERIFVGSLLVLSACPVFIYFLYNLTLLSMIMVPALWHEIPKLAFANAETLYLRGLTFLGYWLMVVWFLPAAGLVLRAVRLRWRYTLENLYLKTIFIRSLKFSLLGFLGWLGCACMYFLADTVFNMVFKITH